MRPPLLHQSGLSPSEFQSYSNIINSLELEEDLILHNGLDSVKVVAVYEWVKGYLIEPSERSIELLFLSFFKASNTTSPSTWILLAILRLIAHSLHSKHLTKDHIFIQTDPIELLSSSSTNSKSTTSWTNPFYRSTSNSNPSSPKSDPMSLSKSYTHDSKSRFTAPPLPLKLRSSSSGTPTSIHSRSSSTSNLNSSHQYSNGSNNTNPFKTSTKTSLPDSTQSSSRNTQSPPSVNAILSPPLSDYSYLDQSSVLDQSFSPFRSPTSSSSKPPLPPRKPSSYSSKPLPPRHKSIDSISGTNSSSKKSMSIIGSSKPEIEIFEPSRRTKSVQSSHIGLDTTTLRQNSPRLTQEEDEDHELSEARAKEGRSDSLNSNSSLNLLGVAYAVTLGTDHSVSPVVGRNNSGVFEGSKSFAGLGGEPESPGTFLESPPTTSLDQIQNIASTSSPNSISTTTSTPSRKVSYRSPPPRRSDLPPTTTTPPLKSSPKFPSTFQTSSVVGASLNRSKTVGSKPSIPPPLPLPNVTTTTIISSSNPPPLPPPKRLQRPESFHSSSTSTATATAKDSDSINPFLGPITLSSPATFTVSPTLNLGLNNLSNNLQRKSSLTTSTTTRSNTCSPSTSILYHNKSSPNLEGVRRSISLRSAPPSSTLTSTSHSAGLGLGTTERFNESTLVEKGEKIKDAWVSKAKSGIEKVKLSRTSLELDLESETKKLGKSIRSRNRGDHTKEENTSLFNSDSKDNGEGGEDEERDEESDEEAVDEEDGFLGDGLRGDVDSEGEMEIKLESLGNLRRDSQRESSGREEGWVGLL